MSGYDLTPRQWRVLTLIHRFLEATCGRSPSVRELGRLLDIGSTNGVIDHLEALERKGYITRTPNTARSIRLTPRARALFGEPQGGPFDAELDVGASCAA